MAKAEKSVDLSCRVGARMSFLPLALGMLGASLGLVAVAMDVESDWPRACSPRRQRERSGLLTTFSN